MIILTNIALMKGGTLQGLIPVEDQAHRFILFLEKLLALLRLLASLLYVKWVTVEHRTALKMEWHF